ncbi:MAG: hypothetical protein RLZZ450_6668 [Pseudomonadota bacterium]
MKDAARVLIVADNASAKFGGEAFLPLHYFRLLRERGIEAWLVTHQRVQAELDVVFDKDRDRIHYVPDTRAHIALAKLGERLPTRVNDVTLSCASQLMTQLMQRRMVRALVREHRITVVHSPTPVSPKQPSALFDVGAPVVIGPMNGGMTFPVAFQHLQGKTGRGMLTLARAAANLANTMLPGKARAAALVVANVRTEAALPSVLRGAPVHQLVENGVDLRRFSSLAARRGGGNKVRFAFVGRLVDWKGVDLLLEALSTVHASPSIELEVFGDGPERPGLTALAAHLGLAERVHFHGFVPQEETAEQLRELDGLILPSLYECGGAVVLEAMASGIPVIATRWGGPADYLDHDCGILIEPTGRTQMVAELASAMALLACDGALRERLGANGRKKVEREYDWERKLDRMLDIYRSVSVQQAESTDARVVSIEHLLRASQAPLPANDVVAHQAPEHELADEAAVPRRAAG